MARTCPEVDRIIEYDGYAFVKDVKTGYFLSAKPINGKRVRLHRYVWNKYREEIPKGYQIHHKDHDKSNNSIDNLVLVLMTKHLKYHSLKEAIEHHEEARNRFLKNAFPKAIEWHKSEAGREWHRKHAKEIAEKNKQKPSRIIICKVCGKEKETRYGGNVIYCSRACKAKALRMRFNATGRDYEYGRKGKRAKKQ